jgi:hypothetical protein
LFLYYRVARETEKEQFRIFLEEFEEEGKEYEVSGNYRDRDFCPEYVWDYKIEERAINFQLRF